jgi:hypothetical protein
MEVETSEPSTQYVNTVVEELKENSQDPDEAFRQAAQRFWSAGQNSTITRINSVGYSYISRNENKQLVLFSVFIDIDLALFSLYWGPIKASSTGATSFAVLQSWETIKAPMSIDDLDTWLPDLPIFGFLGELYHNMKYKKGKKE